MEHKKDQETPRAPAPALDPDAFARNLALLIEESGKAMAAYLKPREDGKAREQMAEDIADVVKTLSKVGEYWMADPQRTLEAQTNLFKGYMDLWAQTMRRMSGEPAEPVIKPDAKDRRFAHPEWSTNPFFDTMKQMYLLTAGWAEKLVQDAETLDTETKLKANFYVRQLASAISPSNFVLTNPELFHETLGSSADNLVRGMQMLTEDITAGKGDLKIRQSDSGEFEVGRNLAASAGKVIFENELFQLIQYAPATETVMSIPLLVVPPWINKFYVLDLTPEKSFIKWMVDQGLTVFVISWVNPEAEHAEKSFSDYMRDGILTALKQIETVTGEKRAHTIGYCVGGTLLAVTLGYLAAKNEDRIESATLLTTQIDFTHAGELKVFVGEEQIAKVEARMREQGYLEASKMATAFNLLRANDLIWPFVVNNYLRGRKPFPFDILFWNSDSTRLPAANHAFYLRNCYLENKLSKGLMTVENTKIDLSKVNIPIYNLATREDHIAPAKSVFLGSQFFGAPVKFVLAGSGHIAGVVNSPLKPKYQYWTGDAPNGDLDAWLASAEEHIGSWWPDWLTWLSNMSGERVPARDPGGGKLAPIEDAPGRYVKVRA
jgi:polyhydroxyalkanoate synthase